MDIYEIRRTNLRAIVKNRFSGKIAGLADAVDRAHSYLSRCLTENDKHRKNIGEDLAREIERLLNLPSLALDQNQENSGFDNVSAARQPVREPRKYPLVSWVEAGEVTEAPGKIGESHQWIESTESAGHEAYWLTVSGHSMTGNGNPTFPEGSLILVKPDADIINGKYYVVEMLDTGEKTFKQYVEDAGYRYLRPLNDKYRTIEIDNNCRFLGRVVDTKMTGL